MIDQAIEEYQKKRIAKIESETKRFEQMVPTWAHQYLRVEVKENPPMYIGFQPIAFTLMQTWEVFCEISYPNACRIAVQVYRPIWFPFVQRVRYLVASPNPFSVFLFHQTIKATNDLREAIAVAVIKKNEFTEQMSRVRIKKSDTET